MLTLALIYLPRSNLLDPQLTFCDLLLTGILWTQ